MSDEGSGSAEHGTGKGGADGGDVRADGGDGTLQARDDLDDLVEGVLAGEHRALARAITHVENRTPGYRELVGRLHEHAGDAAVVGITGSPGSGKSTLVDQLALAYRERGETVGVIAVDPASPFTGGAVLGDRVRMGSTVGDMDVFVRSMSARGALGGLSSATADAVTALDAFGKDRILIETVGAGQNEVDVVRTADTVAVLVQPGAGDAVQTLKAGILEIADCFVVNKADLDGADRTVQELTQMLQLEGDVDSIRPTGHHGADAGGPVGPRDGTAGATGVSGPEDDGDDGAQAADAADDPEASDAADDAEVSDTADDAEASDAAEDWTPPVIETVATRGEGIWALLEAFDDHRAHLERTGGLEARQQLRYAEEIRTLVREDVGELLEAEFERRGGLDALADEVRERETDPYAIAEEVVEPLAECVEDRED